MMLLKKKKMSFYIPDFARFEVKKAFFLQFASLVPTAH